MLTIETMREWLADWARWHLDPSKGYPSTTPVYRAMKEGAPVDSPVFGSSPPIGSELPREIRDIDWKLKKMEGNDDLKPCAWAVKLYYTETISKACAILDVSKPKLFQLKDQGERALLSLFVVRGK